METLGYGNEAIPKPNTYAMTGKILIIAGRHGIPIDEPAAFYEKLRNGELKDFALKNNNKPENCYFLNMILRDYRLLQYLKSRPEWNGKSLTVSGGSMGAFQAVHLAALDKQVSKCSIGIPWCADLAGSLKQQRMPGWRPDYTPSLEYFDIVHQAKRINCKVEIKAGLGDYVCPPSGVAILYNNISCPKSLKFVQGMKHGTPDYRRPKDNQTFTLTSGI